MFFCIKKSLVNFNYDLNLQGLANGEANPVELNLFIFAQFPSIETQEFGSKFREGKRK